MGLIVQKYGGTSVGDLERTSVIANRIREYYEQGNTLVVVVSARGGVTQELLSKAKTLQAIPSARELDVLLTCGEQETAALLTMALHAVNIPAVSLLGWQLRIQTDTQHTNASVQHIESERIQKHLDRGEVVVVAGFQGVNANGDVTTLGRGGSDLTAILLADALQADECLIFTDVEGVYTADPWIVESAQKIERLAHTEMLSLTELGTKVMQAKAAQYAADKNISFEIRSSFNNRPGTLIGGPLTHVISLSIDPQASYFKLRLPSSGLSWLQEALGVHGLLMEINWHEQQWDGMLMMGCTVTKDASGMAGVLIEDVLRLTGNGTILQRESVVQLSLVGHTLPPTLRTYAVQQVQAASIEILGIYETVGRVSLVVPSQHLHKAAYWMHAACVQPLDTWHTPVTA